jgi:ribonuclease BN (tRNA processing enzyme)
LQVVFIGSGVCITSAKRRSPSILVELENDRLLLDAGPGTARALAEMGYSTSRIHHVLLTHLHVDHVNDYAALVNERALTTREPLEVCGPRGLEKHSALLFAQLYPDVASSLRCYDFLRVREAEQGSVTKGDNWCVSCAPTEHAQGIAYRIESGGRALLYSGDAEPSESLVQLGRSVDVAILECSFPDLASLKGKHLVPTTAAELATRMKAKKLVLTHMYPECERRETEMLEAVKAIYHGEVTMAFDGMRIVV